MIIITFCSLIIATFSALKHGSDDLTSFAHSVAKKFNQDSNHDYLYAAYKVLDNGSRIILAPTTCSRRERHGEIVTLSRCGYNRDSQFKEVVVRQQLNNGVNISIEKVGDFNDGAEILSVEDYNLLGIKLREDHLSTNFFLFTKRYNKNYEENSMEFSKRFEIFRNNSKKIELLSIFDPNARYGITQFSDLTRTEFKHKYLGYTDKGMVKNFRISKPTNNGVYKHPESFDWRDHGAVTPVKNQKACGSCWAFSVVANIESRNYLAKNKLVSLSEQELVDCDELDYACDGGYTMKAYESVKKLGGLESEEDYPYVGELDPACKFQKKSTKVSIKDYYQINPNEEDIAEELYHNGPFYWAGVSHPPSFFCQQIDHAVLGVGYGVQVRTILSNQPYWLIKNSWGESWGEKGYFRLYRGDGTCGIDQMVSTSVIA